MDAIISLANPIGSVLDKVKVGIFRFKCLAKSYEQILQSQETSILEELSKEGFSSAVKLYFLCVYATMGVLSFEFDIFLCQIVDRFFRPFLGGIFFDRQLKTSSRFGQAISWQILLKF